MSSPICLRPIGVVEVGLPRSDKVDRFSFVSVVRIFDEYAEGLRGLEEYSHAFVLWHFHEAKTPRLTLKPWGREDLPRWASSPRGSPAGPTPWPSPS